MSSELLIVNFIYAPTEELRDEVTGYLTRIGEWAWKSEPDTKLYGIFIPKDDDKKSVWVIEWYKDQAAFEQHLLSEPVKQIMDWAEDIRALSGYPRITMLKPPTDDLTFVRPTVTACSDPYAVVTEYDYPEGGADSSIPKWEALAKVNKERENGALFFGLGKDVQEEDALTTVELYEKASDFEPSAELESEPDLESERFVLQRIGGWLGRD